MTFENDPSWDDRLICGVRPSFVSTRYPRLYKISLIQNLEIAHFAKGFLCKNQDALYGQLDDSDRLRHNFACQRNTKLD